MNQHNYKHNSPFQLESGEILENLNITYHTAGTMNPAKDNVVWVFHALTANSNCMDWWKGLFGEECLFNPEEHFIICANILGSPYGTTSATSIQPSTGAPYLYNFPFFTIRDMVSAHQILAKNLKISKIKFGIGGSMGGYQLLEWNYLQPSLFQDSIIIASSAQESPWAIAIHEAHRKAIELDPTWKQGNINDGLNGLSVARGFGMLMYRSYECFQKQQFEIDNHKQSNFKSAKYIQYQGQKFKDRFNAICYYQLLNALDSHNISRDRNNNISETLTQITGNFLLIAIDSDYLCPKQELMMMNEHLTNANFYSIDSSYGHDGFLVEHKKISQIIREAYF